MPGKVLIFGNGFIGNRLREELGFVISDRRIATVQDALEEMEAHKPSVVINAVGFTGRNVDDCELYKDKALLANTIVPVILGEACLRYKARLVHISSGCIYHYDYDKNVPIDESVPPDFLNLYYSRTKIYADAALGTLMREYPALIVRIRVPLDNRPNPKNLLDKLIKYRKVIETPNSVTYIPDFIKALAHLLQQGATGIYNVVQKNPLYYPDLMEAYRGQVPAFQYEKINLKQLNLVRTNVVLSTKKLEGTGFAVRDVREVLEECVQGYLRSS